ncbi:hypothetical protein BH09MYX1_BH09MYX1_26970 [soil metagenome]
MRRFLVSVLAIPSVLWALGARADEDPQPPLLPPPPTAEELRIAELEARLAKLEQESEGFKLPDWLNGVSISGFVQPQLLINVYNAAASPNATGGLLPAGIEPNDVTAKPNGDTTNTNFFRIRRARARITYEPNKFARFTIEMEPIVAGGSVPGSGNAARNIEADAIAPFADGKAKLLFGAGIFKVPFNFEMPQSDADRPFVERSFMQRNMFPGEFDTGLHADFTWADKLIVTASLLNGRTIGESDFAIIPDMNRGKDGALRVNYNFGPFDVGVSGYVGRCQVIDATKLRFKQFTRWAVGGEAALHHTFSKKVGQTAVYAEIVLAENMDRGTIAASSVPKIPDDITQDVVDRKELGAFVRVEQNLGKHFVLGFRWDWYTPDYAIAENGRHSLGALFVVNMGKGLKTMLEYDHAMDDIHATGPTPSMRVVDTVSCIMQARL